ncbi:MAG: MFS transporter [Actinomycetota bacterium]
MNSTAGGEVTPGQVRLFATLHFLFGLGIMSWVTRFVDVKRNLGLSNAEFGSLLTIGTIGSLTAFLVMGHLVHIHGVRRILTISSICTFMLIAAATWITSPVFFMFFNIFIAAAISGFHVSITTQTMWMQERLQNGFASRMSGVWSIGALLTSVISILVAKLLSIEIHVTALSAIVTVVTLIIIRKLSPIFLGKNPQEAEKDAFVLAKFFTSLKIDWIVAFGLLFGSILEFVTADWSSIYGREELGLDASLSVVPYFIFIFAMILGRFNFSKPEKRYNLEKLVTVFGIAGGLSMGLGIIFGKVVAGSAPILGLVVCGIGFAGGGYGLSFMWAVFNLRGIERSDLGASAVISQLALFQNLSVFVVKNVVAIAAGIFGLPIAMLIPCIMLMFVGYFLRRASVN